MKKLSSLVMLAGLALVSTLAGCVPVETTPTSGETSTTSGGFMSFLPMIVILVLLFGMFYFLMVRPMRQREKKHDEMVQQLNEGDRVITAGGVYGQIVSIAQDSMVIKIESGATMRVTKGSVLALRSAEGS